MKTKSRHTKLNVPSRYAAGSSREGHSVTTLLAQVEDIERGQRIKRLREDLHLTQPAVVDLLEEEAAKLPATHSLHPSRVGKAPVSLRGYQTWERGGGIAWEKAKLLASVLHADVQAMMNGVPPTGTPDPFDGGNLERRLARLEERIGRQLREHAEAVQALLRRQSELLAAIRASVDEQRAINSETDVLLPLVRDVLEGRPEAAEDRPAVPRQPARAKR